MGQGPVRQWRGHTARQANGADACAVGTGGVARWVTGAAVIAMVTLTAAAHATAGVEPLGWDTSIEHGERIRAQAQDAYARVEASHGLDANPEAISAVEAGELNVAIASWWGFDADDATDALQAAIDSGAALVIVPDMAAPWHVEPIHLTQDDQTLWFEDGVLVKAKEGSFRGRGDCLFEARNRENLNLVGYGATFEMRQDDYQQEPYRSSAWRMGLSIRGSRNVKVLGLTIRRTGGDGIYLGSTSQSRVNENVVIRHVLCDQNYRQGMSVITAKNLLVEHSAFNRTAGSNPQAGIDLEPNRADEQLTDVVIRHCSFVDNHALGMHMFLSNLDQSSEPVSVRWENNHVRGSNAGIHFNRLRPDGPAGEIVYKDNFVEDSRRAGIYIRSKAQDTARIIFDGNVLSNTSNRENASRAAPILLHGRRGADTPRQGGIEFRDTFVYQDFELDRPVLRVLHSYELETYGDVTGRIFVNAPGRVRMHSQAELADSFDVALIPSDTDR